MTQQSITLAITGASGAAYGLRLLEYLLKTNQKVSLVISKAAKIVIATETKHKLPSQANAIANYFEQLFSTKPSQLAVYSIEQWMAPIASGTSQHDAMVICPCSAGSLAAIAHGLSDSLIERAADVTLKERKKLILVPRETPYNRIILENMLKLTEMGTVILPASPGFYFNPETIDELIDFIVGRILQHLNIPHDLTPQWGAQQG